MYSYIFEPRAAIEYKEAILWYLEISLYAAENFDKLLKARIDEICLNPTLHNKTRKNYREAVVVKYPFSVIYFVEEEIRTVVIISIFHHKRNPKLKYRM